MTRRKFPCPSCKQRTGVRIMYGYPSEELFQEAGRGEVALGGCCRPLGAPDRQCLACGRRWAGGARASPSAG